MALTQVRSDGIATGAVTATQIATGAVTANDLEDSGVTAGTYGSSSAIPAITVDAKGRITSASTNSVTQVGGANGVDFNDSVKARFGTGNDLEIYHDGGHSIIADVGQGQLRLWSNAFRVQNAAGTETQISTNEDGAVNLAFDGSDKLSTTSGGINVTGQMVSDGIVSDGGVTFTNSVGPQLVLKDNDNSGTGAQSTMEFHDSANASLGVIGYPYNNNHDFEIKNRQNGPIWFGANNTNRVYLDAAGHFIPGTNNAYDLGTTSNRWRNVYTNDLNLSNEGGTNDVDGTWGSWTIQEGEDDLFLLNRRNGKKYKFNLSEVN